MTKLNILYEGKAKILYETNVSNELIQLGVIPAKTGYLL